jgi:hypothetical protein
MLRRIMAAAGAALVSLAMASTASAATAAGSSLEGLDLGSAVPYQGGHAIPLKAKRPAWFTRELERRVDAADGVPVQAPPDAPLPSEVGIRPGSWMLAPAGCTMNFVFGSPGSYSIGTAGHCGNAGQQVTLLTVAPGGANPVLVDIGNITVSHNNDIGDDFALVSIRPELQEWVFPTMAFVGGPCGSYTGSGPEVLAHTGHGLGVGTGGTPRVGVALTWQANAYGWDGAAAPGDSGSAVRVTSGLQAAGNLTHLVVDTEWVPSFIVGTRIGKMQQIAGRGIANSALC